MLSLTLPTVLTRVSIATKDVSPTNDDDNDNDDEDKASDQIDEDDENNVSLYSPCRYQTY